MREREILRAIEAATENKLLDMHRRHQADLAQLQADKVNRDDYWRRRAEIRERYQEEKAAILDRELDEIEKAVRVD